MSCPSSVDDKVVGRRYIVTAFVFFFLGGIYTSHAGLGWDEVNLISALGGLLIATSVAPSS